VDGVAGRHYDLTILCDVETPFSQDEYGVREDGPHRQRMHDAYLSRLIESGAPFIVVSGPHAERLRTAIAAIDGLLGEPAKRRARVPAWLTTSRASSPSLRAAGEASA